MKKKTKRLKVRDEITRLEHFNPGVGSHESLINKKRRRNSKESQKEKLKLKEYLR